MDSRDATAGGGDQLATTVGVGLPERVGKDRPLGLCGTAGGTAGGHAWASCGIRPNRSTSCRVIVTHQHHKGLQEIP